MLIKVKIKQNERKPRYLMVINGEFDSDLYREVIDYLAPYISKKDSYSGITIFITSLGGSVHIGLAIYDLLKSLNTSVYTVALGECTSAATLVFSLGEKRFVSPNTLCLMHSVSIESEGMANQRDINEKYSRMKLYNTKMTDVYKSTKNITKEFLDFIDDLFKNTREVSLNANDLLKFNFATDIFDKLEDVQ